MPRTARQQAEALPKSAIRKLFETYHWKVLPLQEGPFGVKGVPDLLCKARVELYSCPAEVWIEVKRPPTQRNKGGHVRRQQALFILMLWELGVPAIVADSLDPLLPIASGALPLDAHLDYTRQYSLEAVRAAVKNLPQGALLR